MRWQNFSGKCHIIKAVFKALFKAKKKPKKKPKPPKKVEAAEGGVKFTQGAADDLVVGLKNTHGGNVTVMKDGVDIFRVHQPGTHRSSVATITKIREHMTPKGPMRIADSKSSPFDQSTFDMLRQAANNQGGYSVRTLGGR
ncbi:MAG: hypothetical protein EAZ57_02970 [Cytophagales bacterium]|nr:MAG: hypothetical protein EAZ67_03435 [Cytophagales bacterium]TAF61721.1 MAG: hypothetical protein EAZ57_02970 [Cytophagales bacterium]